MAALLDTQGPLTRRKALIARLMGQMQGGQPGQPRSLAGLASGIPGTRITLPHLTEGARAANPNVVANRRSEGVSRISELPFAPSASDPVPTQQPQGGAPGAPQASPWQSGGYVSPDAYNVFSNLDEGAQARILANPVARRRYFS
jgi:hypothetical protein